MKQPAFKEEVEKRITAGWMAVEEWIAQSHQSPKPSEKNRAISLASHQLAVCREFLALKRATLPERQFLESQERLQQLTSRLVDIDRRLRVEIESEAQRLRCALQSFCEEAQAADNPCLPLEKGLEAISDNRYRPLLVDFRRLLATCTHKDAKRILIPFFRQCFIEERADLLAARETAAQLLLLAEYGKMRSLRGSFAQVQSVLEERALSIVKAQKHVVDRRIARYSAAVCYEAEDVEDTLVPQAVAGALVRKDGTLNLGLIRHVKSVFLPPKAERDAMERHIASSLQELQSNEAMVDALESLPTITDPDAIEDVNCVLGRPLATPLTRGDSLQAVLTAFFTRQRQKLLGNCYLIAPEAIRRESCGLWMIHDLQELLTKQRTITRTIDGQEVSSVGLPWLHKEAVLQSLDISVCTSLFSLPHVQEACAMVGCTTAAEFGQLAQAIAATSDNGGFSLLEIFEALCQRKDPLSSSDRLVKAIRIIEAFVQNPLLRMWENAMGGFLFPPLNPSHFPLHLRYPRTYVKALAQFSINHAKRIGLHDIASKLAKVVRMCEGQQEAPLCLPENAVPSSWALLRPCMIPETNSAIDDLSFAMMRVDPQSQKLVPFRSSEEFGEFIVHSFEEWVDSLAASGQSPVHRKKYCGRNAEKYLKEFDGILQQETSGDKIVSGVCSGFLYYVVSGGASMNFLGQNVLEVSAGTKEQFGDSIARAIPSFFNWADSFHQEHGGDPSYTVGATALGHAFRLLPNHSSFLPWHGNGKAMMAAVEKATAEICARTDEQRSFFALNAPVIDSIAEVVVNTAARTDVTASALKSQMRREAHELLKANTQPSVLDFCMAILNAAHNLCCAHARERPSDGDLIAFQYSLLTQCDMAYPSLVTHFADTNWTTNFSGRREDIHYALWFDPFQKKWTVIALPEGGRMYSNTSKKFYLPVCLSEDFFSLFFIQRVHPAVEEQRLNSAMLKIERKRAKRSSP